MDQSNLPSEGPQPEKVEGSAAVEVAEGKSESMLTILGSTKLWLRLAKAAFLGFKGIVAAVPDGSTLNEGDPITLEL